MAPFTISPHHPLPVQCCLPQEALFIQSKMSPELLSSKPGTHEDLPLNYYHKTSIMKIRLHLWQVIRRVVNCCMSVAELFCSKMFFFICVGKNMTMTGEMKCGVEALEREIRDGKDLEMKVLMELDDDDDEELIEPAVERESSMIDSDEEEDDEARLSEWESDEETDEEEDEDTEEEDCEPQDVDSEWSDDDDDDEGDSEASAESLELWESFLNSSDPYNPLSFCSSTSSRTNTKQNQLTQIKTQPSPATSPEECHPKPNSKEGGKKVCFSDKVTVHPLVVWSFASRAARDGSCWLQMARDRERFRRRVENIENVIKPCLTPEHRASVWERLQRKTWL
ncbi:protein phosphatase 1 regulatory subunit 15A [Chanodichthys erythropterus]|uniref:protein phosphatase 1 regulatory subunit 15A n=1 Tax=Chanodichthys erythropterus TaxID=933992 RepID=UPI00351F7073